MALRNLHYDTNFPIKAELLKTAKVGTNQNEFTDSTNPGLARAMQMLQ